MKGIKFAELDYHKVFAAKMTPNMTVPELLAEMFRKLTEQELFPKCREVFQNESVFDKDIYAFCRWNSPDNLFKLEIFGEELPDIGSFPIAKNALPPTAEFFEQSLKNCNEMILKHIFNEMAKQNILGVGNLITGAANVIVGDFFYYFTLCWSCFPYGTNESDWDRSSPVESKIINQ